MPASFILPPDPSDTRVTFDLPKALAPYARELYNALKLEDETFELFVCRKFCEEAVRTAMRIELNAVNEERRTDETLDHVALGQEMTTLLE